MKGYLTVFLSLSLSILTGFVLLLTGHAVQNGWKVRLEGVVDMGMNSVLGEYQIELHDRYDLLYIDTSYESREPSISNMEDRLTFYISQNTQKKTDNGPWGSVMLNQVTVSDVVSAAAGKGMSMKNQAVRYVEDSLIIDEGADISAYLGSLSSLNERDAEGEWSALMAQIAGMKLPEILNEDGEWEEVPLSNPADGIFSLLGSDVLYLAGVNLNQVSSWQIRKEDYISERIGQKTSFTENAGDWEAATDLFLVYLFEKMGNYGRVRQDGLLQLQLEYIAKGKGSDYENLRAVTAQLFGWRFASNVDYVFGNSGLYQEAAGIAQMLHVVQLDSAFLEPVTRSILYACAYLETIGDVRCLLSGGRVEIHKTHFQAGIEHVLQGSIPEVTGGSGLNYEQYLAYMLYLLSEDIRNLRAMDIMEMDIRKLSGNRYFSMDFCIEKYTAEILATGSGGRKYMLVRTYGYY